jgi:signal transduction histidine kinase
MKQRANELETRVLILAPTGQDTQVLSAMLVERGIHPFVCASIEALCDALGAGAGAGIIADEALDDRAVELLGATLTHQPEWSDFPLIIMTSGERDGLRARVSLADIPTAINVSILERPVYKRALQSAVRSALRSRTRQYQTREELRRRHDAEASLRAANRELEAFTYTVSHDLKNPLNTIQAMTDILKDFYSPALDEDGKRCIAEIVNSRKKMTDMIDDLLRLSRISRQELDRERVDLSAMARRGFEQLRRLYPERTIEARIEEGMSVFADPGLLSLVLENLIGNALKYTAPREKALIEVGTTTLEGERGIFVRDNGVGFDMRRIDRLFQPFQRLHDQRRFSGAGVGMSIVKRVIDRHGGRIRAESEVDRGTTFTFTLPEQ